MKPSKALLAPWHKRILYFTIALLWLSGTLWLYYKYFGQINGEYGLQAHPLQPLCLEIHGAAAMAFLVIFGTLLVQHVPAGWQQDRQRPSGILLLTVCGLLTLTGYGLYYFAGENLRLWTHWTHIVIGLVLPLLIYLHIWLGRRS